MGIQITHKRLHRVTMLKRLFDIIASVIGHDAAIHDFATLSPQVMLGGHTVIEAGAEIGAASLA